MKLGDLDLMRRIIESWTLCPATLKEKAYLLTFQNCLKLTLHTEHGDWSIIDYTPDFQRIRELVVFYFDQITNQN